MTKDRRKALSAVICDIRKSMHELERILEQEQTAYDNIPENLADSERCLLIEENVGFMEDVVSMLDDAIDELHQVR